MSRPIHASPAAPPTAHPHVQSWVRQGASLTRPRAVHWCDGSVAEYDRLCQELVDAGTFERLSGARRPNSYLTRSDPGDVRLEDRTFVGLWARLNPTRRGAQTTARPSANAKNADRSVPRRDARPHDVRRTVLDGPGDGENSSVLAWVFPRCDQDVPAVRTPIGLVPSHDDADLPARSSRQASLPISSKWTRTQHTRSCHRSGRISPKFGDRLPAELYAQLTRTELDLGRART